jgi:hypothetical protein
MHLPQTVTSWVEVVLGYLVAVVAVLTTQINLGPVCLHA